MKKLVLFAAIAIAALGFSACQKSELKYSCNPTIDGIIKQNLPYYQGMTREEWKTLPDSLKNAAFAAMPPELKKEFWKGKYNEMMEYEHFTNTEKVHISKLYNYALSIDDLYTDKYAKDSVRVQKVRNYYKGWAIYGVDSLNWDIFDVFLIAEDMEELTEDYISSVKQRSPETELKDAKSTKCNCNYTLPCWLSGEGFCDPSKDCDEVKRCGLLLSEYCTGRCSDSPIDSNGASNGASVADVKRFRNMPQRELLNEMFK